MLKKEATDKILDSLMDRTFLGQDPKYYYLKDKIRTTKHWHNFQIMVFNELNEKGNHLENDEGIKETVVQSGAMLHQFFERNTALLNSILDECSI